MEPGEKPIHYKPYDETLDGSFKWAESIVNNYVIIPHHYVKANPDKYKIDFLVYKDDFVVGGLEVESHGKYWKNYEFPFNTVHFLGRKIKLIQPNCFYILVNNEGDNACMIPFSKLREFRVVELDNKRVDREHFFDVPNSSCIFRWENILKHLDNHFNNRRKKMKHPTLDFFVRRVYFKEE